MSRAPFDELGADCNGMRVWGQHQAVPPYRYTTPWPGRAHGLLLWDAAFEAPEFPNDDMNRLTDEIVLARCAWCHSAGFNASEWDDFVDMVHIMARVEGSEKALPIAETMTTWSSLGPRKPFTESDWSGLVALTEVDGLSADEGSEANQMTEAAQFFCHDMGSHGFGESDEYEPFDVKLIVCLGGAPQTYARLRSLVVGLLDH